MNFAAFGACGRNMPPMNMPKKRKGGRSPEYSGTPPPFLSR